MLQISKVEYLVHGSIWLQALIRPHLLRRTKVNAGLTGQALGMPRRDERVIAWRMLQAAHLK